MPSKTQFAIIVALLSITWTVPGHAQRPGYVYPPPFPYRNFDPESAVRIEATPKEAEVYVDGYYTGIVDDFDGRFQRLRLPPGEHEIVLYRDGYRAFHQKLYLIPESTFDIRQTMERLDAGESGEPRPVPAAPAPAGQTAAPPPPGGPPVPRMPPGPSRRTPAEVSSYGTLAIRVQPANADIFIDGEQWHGPDAQDRLVVDVGEGPHHIEIRKEAYETFSTDVQVRRGDTTPLNVSLRSISPQ